LVTVAVGLGGCYRANAQLRSPGERVNARLKI
jgi:hypothetical protein